MAKPSLLDRIASLPEPPPEPSVPPIELVAFTVKVRRNFLGMKQSVLAEYAGVSLSTVERIERGEKVATESLDRIAIALGYDAGYFTTPRAPKTRSEVKNDLAEEAAHLIPVEVAPITKQSQIRFLTKSHGLHIEGVGDRN